MPARARRRLGSSVGAVLTGLLATAGILAAAPAAVADVTTVSVDTYRTGWDRNEPGLSPSDVSASDFGQLFSTQLDGQVYAQPVVAKNTLLAVTENDKAYGLDPVTGKIRWTRDVGPAWSVAPLGCGDLVPNIGITATPVVDPATGTAYFTAKVDSSAGADNPRWEMHAIDITTGAERSGFPSVITGSPDNDPTHSFRPRTAMQRPGLLLLDGAVYAGFASHCDHQPYVGYVIGVDATSGRRTSMWATETGNVTAGAGIWQGGGGLVSDGSGRIIVSTGNGVSPTKSPGSPTPSNLAESVIRLQVGADRKLSAADFFSPVNATNLDTDDTDLGAGGPMALPDGYGTTDHPHLLVESGKDGRVFLLDRDHLGGSSQGAGDTDDVLQTAGPYKGVWGHPGFWGGDGGYVYLTTNQGPLSAFKVGVSGSGQPLLSRTGTSVSTFGYTSGSPVVTSSGTTSGSALVWNIYSDGPSGAGGQLRAYDAVPSRGTLALRYSVPIGTATKFSVPATDRGRVYVANRTGQVFGFGRPTTTAVVGGPTSFGLVAVGQTSTKQVTVTAQQTVTVSAVATQAPFSTGQVTLPVTLEAGQTLTVPVTFSPSVVGADSASLAFTTSAGTFAFDVHGTGTADGLVSDPGSLDFDEVPVGGRVTLSVNIANGGATSTTITGATAPSAPFAAATLPASGSTLAPGASVSVPLTFSPSAVGDATTELVVRSSTGDVHVPLSGTGVSGSPELTLSPTTLDFGTVKVGQSVTKTFDIANTGNLLLTLSKAAPPTAPFLVPLPVAEGQQIEPGDVVHQSVTFSPTEGGPSTGTYSITGNDGRGPQLASVRGTGLAPSVTGPITGLAGKCLDVRWGATADGTPVQLFTCNQTNPQKWVVKGDGTIRGLGRCLDVVGQSTASSTKTVLFTCNGSASQLWRAKGAALVNLASGRCLDVPSSQAVDKTQLQIYTCNSTAAQKWVLPK